MTLPVNTIIQGDAIGVMREWPDKSVNCCVTSPPYWSLRDYDVEGQLGLEPTPEKYVAKMVAVFREVRRVLRDDGTCWINMGDSYLVQQGKGFNGQKRMDDTNRNIKVQRPKWLKPKDLCGIPWRVAFALQADGWYLRQDIIWHKPNPMPESVTDRCTKAHEYIFLLSKRAKYYCDMEAIREEGGDGSDRWGGKRMELDTPKAFGGNAVIGQPANRPLRAFEYNGTRNKRSVWTVPTAPYPDAHFATYPPKLIEPCILAGCPESGVVLDPFMGAGTTALVAYRNNRNYVGIELNPEYRELAEKRIDTERDKYALLEVPE